MKERLQEENPDAILFDGLDEAIIGIGNQYTKAPVAIYSVAKILQILADDHGYDGAVEWFDHNIACLWAGEHTPILMQDDV
jgi:hypothetical protein